tara:strand:- start:910 stop:1635 length:726 start_codon:yes stop_codon:yes gene_type:complete
MKNYADTLDILRSRDFALHVIALVESIAAGHFVGAARMKKSIRTIQDWAESAEEQKRQQTSVVSVRIAYDFEFAIHKACEDFGLPALDKEEGDSPGHDFRIETTDMGIVPFEVKTTQSTNGWTGSTHSEGKGKATNYVLVSYELDKDISIPLDGIAFHGAISSAHFSVLSGCEMNWAGEATNNNSSTTGKIHVDVLEDYRDSISLGKVRPAKKWCKIIRENISTYRNTNNQIGDYNVIHAP